METISRGAVSGFLATGPMTYAMMALFRELPRTERSPFPPATISEDFTREAGVPAPDSDTGKILTAFVAHFGYGASVGVPYALLFSRSSWPLPVKGALYGTAVWAGSYLGLLRSLGVRATAPKMTWKRNAMMIGVHLIWGWGLAYAEEQLRRRGEQMFRGDRKAPRAE